MCPEVSNVSSQIMLCMDCQRAGSRVVRLLQVYICPSERRHGTSLPSTRNMSQLQHSLGRPRLAPVLQAQAFQRADARHELVQRRRQLVQVAGQPRHLARPPPQTCVPDQRMSTAYHSRCRDTANRPLHGQKNGQQEAVPHAHVSSQCRPCTFRDIILSSEIELRAKTFVREGRIRSSTNGLLSQAHSCGCCCWCCSTTDG